MQIGAIVPALHLYRQQFFGFDQLGDPRLGLGHAHAEVVAQVALRRHALGARGDPDQFALGIFAARRLRARAAAGNTFSGRP
jgi:hypothetical protein